MLPIELGRSPDKDANYRRYRLVCGHEKDAKKFEVEHGKCLRCPTCSDIRLMTQASKVGAVFLRHTTARKGEVRLPCGCERDVHLAQLRTGVSLDCTLHKHSNLAVRPNVRPWSGRGVYTLECGHNKYIPSYEVYINNFNCKQCREAATAAVCASNGWVWSGRTGKGRGVVTLPCGHQRISATGDINRATVACHTCGTHSWVLPSYIYVLKIECKEKTLVKLGHSSNIPRRVSSYGLVDGAIVTELGKVAVADRQRASAIEHNMRRLVYTHKIKKVEAKNILTKSGFNECFSPASVPILLDYLTKLEQPK